MSLITSRLVCLATGTATFRLRIYPARCFSASSLARGSDLKERKDIRNTKGGQTSGDEDDSRYYSTNCGMVGSNTRNQD